MADSIKVTIDGKEQEVFLKDDVVQKSDFEKVQRELEDVRMEVLTPQYDDFLKAQEAASKTGGKTPDQLAAEKLAAEKSVEDTFQSFSFFQKLDIGDRLSDPHVHNDLFKPGNLHAAPII